MATDTLKIAQSRHGAYTGCGGKFTLLDKIGTFDEWRCSDCGTVVKVSDMESWSLEATISIKDVGQCLCEGKGRRPGGGYCHCGPGQAAKMWDEAIPLTERVLTHTAADIQIAQILYCDCLVTTGELCNSCVGIMVKASKK